MAAMEPRYPAEAEAFREKVQAFLAEHLKPARPEEKAQTTVG